MEIKNLKEQEVDTLETMVKVMKIENPDIKYKIFPMEMERGDCELTLSSTEVLQRIEHKLDKLTTMIKHIFGDAVLIEGKWITPRKEFELDKT